MDALTLYQFKVFLAILEEGSFAAAARRLGRAQSAISYAVQKLEDQIGLSLFDRSQYRPALTEAGRALAPKVRRIIENVDEFKMQAQTMNIGVEPQVKLVIDNYLPLSVVAPSLIKFREAYPYVELQVKSDWTDDAARGLIEGQDDLGIFTPAVVQSHDLEVSDIGKFEIVIVVSSGHPLAKTPNTIPKQQLLNCHQIVIENPNGEKGPHSFGLTAIHQWSVTNNRMQVELICSGLGWGALPRSIVTEELDAGKLVELTPTRWDTGNNMPVLNLLLAKRKDKVLGPAATFLMSQISKQGDAV